MRGMIISVVGIRKTRKRANGCRKDKMLGSEYH